MELTKLFISLQNQSFFAGKLAENIWIDNDKEPKVFAALGWFQVLLTFAIQFSKERL